MEFITIVRLCWLYLCAERIVHVSTLIHFIQWVKKDRQRN